jgi:NADPH:quinone reductase-like Zn-dependent oxidoreductase
MKAIVVSNYGSPDVLKCDEVDKPTAGDDQVLIKVRAASVNPLDRMVRGKPYLIRLMTGLRKPKDTRLGRDVAGEVEAVGRNVTRFKPGDAVFGTCRGAFAEYACALESKLAMKPNKVTFEQAASVPVAGLTALQGLRDKGQIRSGAKVLINGAAGGVGTFAVQIAKSFGAEVTAVCSTGKVDMVLSIGADRIIDYTREDFTKGEQRYDLIFDCAGTRSLSALRRLLNPKGVYILVGAPAQGRWVGPLAQVLKTLVASWFVSEKLVLFLAQIRTEDLTILGELIEAGRVTPVIGKRYRLSEVPEAIRYLEEGHARGKVVITV